MDTSTKKELALAFFQELAEMPSSRLQEIIRNIVGEELATVLFNYARQVVEASPEKAVENASSMLILGYLVRAHEENQIPPVNPPV